MVRSDSGASLLCARWKSKTDVRITRDAMCTHSSVGITIAPSLLCCESSFATRDVTVPNDTTLKSELLGARLAVGFAARLAPHFLLEQLELHPASIFGLAPDGKLAYVNPAWVRFAQENGAVGYGMPQRWIGHRYLDVIAEPLRTFYSELFELAPRAGSTLQPVSHVYECSSPEMFRQFAMKVYGLANGGHVVINTLVSSRPHDIRERVPRAPDRALYQSAEGMILQCAHCRLIRRADRTSWDWIPAWIVKMPVNTSHGVCEVCLEYYYPHSD